MTKKILTAVLLGLGSLSASAQLSGSVSVEGVYEPVVIESERFNSFPRGYKFELPAADLQYDFSGIVTDFKPGLISMGVTGRQSSLVGKRPRGYVDFRIGSYLNSRLRAGYWPVADSVNSLKADLNFDCSTLYRATGVPASFSTPPRKRFYEGSLGLSFSRLVGYEGLLNASARYRTGYFNYYGTSFDVGLHPADASDLHIPSQTFFQALASVGYSSSPSIIRGWHAEGSFSFFALRRLYGRMFEFYPTGQEGFATQRGDRESRLSLGGGYAFPFSDVSALSVDADADIFFYPDRKPAALGILYSGRKNYGIVSLKPSYRFVRDGLSVSAGIDLDISCNAMGSDPDKRFAALHLAPDVTVRYGSPSGVGLFLTATGGVSPSSLMLREQFDRYQMPWLLSTLPVYSPVDARLGLNFGPFSGFTGQLAVRYAVADNVPLGGWYQAYLGSYLPDVAVDHSFYCDPWLQSVSLHGFSFDLDLSYAFGSVAYVGFNGCFTPQNRKTGIFNGFDRPEWILAAKAGANPWKRLSFDVGFDFRGSRRCYLWSPFNIGRELYGYRLRNMADLNLKVSYGILENLDLYVRADNLLNRRVDFLPGLQSEGIVFSGGFFWEF